MIIAEDVDGELFNISSNKIRGLKVSAAVLLDLETEEKPLQKYYTY